jgi:hypothetical protein
MIEDEDCELNPQRKLFPPTISENEIFLEFSGI